MRFFASFLSLFHSISFERSQSYSAVEAAASAWNLEKCFTLRTNENTVMKIKKAIRQGAIPLATGLACGQTILTCAVLSILVTALLGAALTDLTYKNCLQKRKAELTISALPFYNEVRFRRFGRTRFI